MSNPGPAQLFDQINENVLSGLSNILTPEDFHDPGIENITEYINTSDELAFDTYLSEFYHEDLYLFEKTINENIRQFINENQGDENLSEILPALLPIITSVAPTVIKGVSSVISNARKGRAAPKRQPVQRSQPRQAAPQQQSPPPQQQQQQRPRPRPQMPPVRQAPVSGTTSQSPAPSIGGSPGSVPQGGASVAGASPSGQAPPDTGTAPSTSTGSATSSSSPVDQLLNLLSNQSIISLIQRATGAGGGESTFLGPQQVEVSVGSVLNAISQYAQLSSEYLEQEGLKEIPEYLIDAEGNFKCDIYSPRERAEVLVEMINEKS